MTEKVRFNHFIQLLTDFEANGSFADVKANVAISDEPQHAWYVRATDLENKSDPFKCKWVNEHSYNFLRKTPLLGNELLIAKRGEIGKVYLFQKPNNIKYATLAPNLYLINLRDRELARYLFYYFISNKGKKSLLRINASSTIGALYKDDVKNLNIDYHSNADERKLICTTLSSVDQKINLLTKKKETLEAYKKGLMQKIFSQELRFKREDGTDYPEWLDICIGDAAIILKGKGVSKADICDDGTFDCIRYGEIYTVYKEVINTVISKTNQNPIDSVKSVKGDVLIPASGETAIDMATACSLMLDDVLIGGDINVVRLKHPEYSELFAYALSNTQRSILGRLAQGVSVVHLYGKHLATITIPLPSSLEEIIKIKDMLSKLSDLIATMSADIKQVENLKKGLLQQMFV